MPLRIAIAQYTVGEDKEANLRTLAGYAERAARADAGLLVCPEAAMVGFPPGQSRAREAAEPLDGPFVTGVRKISAQTGLTVVIGMHETGTDNSHETTDPDAADDRGGGGSRDRRVHNTLVVAEGGELTARYRKLHLYDAFAKKESANIAPGDEPPVTFRCGGLTIGLATCYDLRFPEIFRDLADRGADVLAVPAAWVRGTLKEDHWLTLLRARAIENTCYVVAPAKVNQACIGRSAAFDPLGLQLADLGEAPGLAVIEATRERLDQVRAELPVLEHRRYAVTRG